MAWSFIKRKSELLTTAVELINADTIIAHDLLLPTVFLLFHMTSWVNQEFTWPPFVAISIGIWFYIITNITIIYYSLGISLRYFFIWKRRTYLIEDWTDQDVRRAAFILALTCAVVPNVFHLAFGGYTRFYSELTGSEQGKDVRGLVIQLIIIFISITLNVTFRILIIREKRHDALNESKTDLNGAMAILIFVVFLTGFLVAVLLLQGNPEAISIVRFIGGTFICLGVPLIIMLSSNEFLQFMKKMLMSKIRIFKSYIICKKASTKVTPLVV